jgi:alkyl hydroperoxide reductase subunit AhpC
MKLLSIGDLAPDFELPALIGGVKRKFRLSSQRGKKHVLLAFYPANWSEISRTQLTQFQAEKNHLQARQALAVSVSVDSIMNTTAWEREIGPLDFPMCADFWPHGEVCAKFGVLRDKEPMRGAGDRAIYVIDKIGKIVFHQGCELEELPSLTKILDCLEKLS